VVFILWWTGMLHFRDLLPIPRSIQVELATVWDAYYWPVLGYTALEIGANLLAFARPGLIRLNAGLSALRHAVGAVLLIGVLQASHWVSVTAPGLHPDAAQTIQRNFDVGLRIGLLATVACMALQAVRALWILGRDLRARPVAA
jgi:NO-binding membrane sensor protein with MHYT domain